MASHTEKVGAYSAGDCCGWLGGGVTVAANGVTWPQLRHSTSVTCGESGNIRNALPSHLGHFACMVLSPIVTALPPRERQHRGLTAHMLVKPKSKFKSPAGALSASSWESVRDRTVRYDRRVGLLARLAFLGLAEAGAVIFDSLPHHMHLASSARPATILKRL